jgi:hypothetical protein
MSDIVTTEAPAEPVPPISPEPELEAESAPPEAAPEAAEPAAAASAEKVDQAAPEGDAPGDAPEIAFANGSTSDLIVNHFIDSAESGDQSMTQIKAALPHIAGNTIESAVRRLVERGRLIRVAPGVYRLGPETPAEPAKPAAPPPPRPTEEATWFEALEHWAVDPSTWDVEELGPRPNEPDNKIPPDVRLRFADRRRKRQERERDREAALAKQAEADAALRAKLIHGCFNNVVLGAPGLSDLSPIRAMLRDVDIQFVMLGLKRRTDKRIDPQAAPIASWRDERFLTEVARAALLGGLLPQLVQGWKAAGTAQAKLASASEASPAIPEPAPPESPPAPSSP